MAEVVEETVEEVQEEDATPNEVDYSSKTLTELKAIAKEQGIKGYSTMKKDELLEALK